MASSTRRKHAPLYKNTWSIIWQPVKGTRLERKRIEGRCKRRVRLFPKGTQWSVGGGGGGPGNRVKEKELVTAAKGGEKD